VRFRRQLFRAVILFLLYLPWCSSAFANSQGMLRGRVADPLGGAVPNADVALMLNGKPASGTKTNPEGLFEFAAVNPGRYTVHVEAKGFEKQDSPPVFLRAGGMVNLELLLQIGSI